LSEIEAGGMFASLARKLGCAELTENRRLQDPAEQTTAIVLRSRRVEEALRQLRRSDRLTVLDNAELVRDRMAEDWYLEHADGKHAVMLALHRSDVADLNRRARSQLAAHGKLGPPVLRVDGVDFAIGDRVVALRNDRKIGLLNGTQATVAGRAGSRLLIETVDGTRTEVPPYYLANGHVAHAYALTIHKGQGMTCDAALVLGGDTLYAEAGYTAITRGRFRNHVYAVAAPESDDRLASLRRGLEQSRAKATALEAPGLTP
ncbi:MAG TPA: hypothetical protein VFA96_02645, partial [Nocardioides sp.]|nr:hypothetical protein [Nocardioides sp.]